LFHLDPIRPGASRTWAIPPRARWALVPIRGASVFWRARAGLYSPGKRTREGTARRGGGDGDRERRSPYLPSGYYLDALAERDLVILRRPDGSEVAVYSTTGTDPKEI
jgi:hypothetical protein